MTVKKFAKSKFKTGLTQSANTLGMEPNDQKE